MNTTDVSSTFRLFGDLPDSVQARILETCSTRTYEEGQQIFCQGDAPEAFYIVMTGRVKVVRVTLEGYENILCMRGPGDHFCPVPLLDFGTQLGQAVAMAPTTVLWIDKDSFLDLCKDSVELLSIIQGDCLNEVRNLLERLEIIAFRSVEQRIAHVLISLCRSKSDEDQTTTLNITQHELGALVGASRESVSRTLSRFQDRNLVDVQRGKILIKDRHHLEQLAHPHVRRECDGDHRKS